MYNKWAGIAGLFLAAVTGPQALHAQDDNGGQAVLNAQIKSELTSPFGQQSIAGRLSAFLRLDPSDIDKGRIRVGGLNVLYLDVPQGSIVGEKREGKETGALGFVIDGVSDGRYQTLDYDPQALVLEGVLQGRISHTSLTSDLRPELGLKEGHDFEGVSQDANVKISIRLGEPLEASQGKEDVVPLRGDAVFEIEVLPLPAYDLPGYRIGAREPFVLDLQVGWWQPFEVSRRLCLQPVRIGQITQTFSGWPFIFPQFTVLYSGSGLNFGMPGANTQWAKADVNFIVRDWKTVFNSAYSTLSESEAGALRASVQDDDCVEMFFVDQFSPSDQWGGGATWSGGLAETQIISSDENADHGIDFTHLAHEIGHAITLKHPGSGFPNASAPNRVDGSTGTLMCPSGFMNDNPAFNSEWNEDSVQNPLFTFAIKLQSAGPDCLNDADCGAC